MGCAGDRAHGPGKRLIRDERLRRELELCDRWGIPHSLFRGIGDGGWTVRDRAKALAYLEYQRTVCPQCNTRYDDWDHGQPGEEDAYAVSVQRCVGCQVIADKQDELARNTGDDQHGVKVALIPAATAAALAAHRSLADRRRSTGQQY
ncbi:hypothetical protein [Streptomyces sp. ML-6]|uniref:hypothetical protein n=1 Tax=Streptomyces sp. ML-6 TaxID=2982693 RepID=UPI0024BFDF36|nr:hypothetical protein [Streptomyces sp. ML-6]MDK0525009.1 hypothetical protein [Streptomyces sp. ML-6]